MIRAGGFQMGVPVGIGLAGKTLGVLGLGRLGGYMATYWKALRMNVIAWSQNLTAEKADGGGREAGVEGRADGDGGRDQHPHGAVRPQPRVDGGGGHRADEAGRDPGEYLARADRG